MEYNNINKMKTADLKFLSLCDEIDYWKARAEAAEKDAEYWKNESTKMVQENLLSAQKGVANALMFALSVKDDEKGNLIIEKEDREILAKTYKT